MEQKPKKMIIIKKLDNLNPIASSSQCNTTSTGSPEIQSTSKNNRRKFRNKNSNRNNQTNAQSNSAQSNEQSNSGIIPQESQSKKSNLPNTNQVNSNKKPQRKRTNNWRPKSNVGSDVENTDLLTSLTTRLTNHTYDCMVCFEIVKNKDRIWCCQCCFAIFHLKCVNKWALKSIETGTSQPNINPESITQWRCPGCQNISPSAPREYECFCGKTVNPQFDRYICPHSCGQTCFKSRKCTHPCTNICHPGPCPPCEGTAPAITCACKKTVLNLRCSDMVSTDFVPSCDEECNRTLNCGIHSCSFGCHEAPCPKCPEKIQVTCYCGNTTKERSCGDSTDSFSCENQCGFQFKCGNHCCEDICHEHEHNDSDLCPYDITIVTHCPCNRCTVEELLNGQTRASCSDPIPTCLSDCGNILVCGHACSSKCHLGPCPPCPKSSEKACLCGSTQSLAVKCVDLEFNPNSTEPFIPRCSKKCEVKLSCGSHSCLNTCCTLKSWEHECDQLCGKLLKCKLHKCLMSCMHDGPCHDCVEGVSFDELACSCGRTITYPPIPCGTKPPDCNHSCQRVRSCSHPNFTQHYCHPDEEQCPPCMVFTERSCACGSKVLKNIPCSRQTIPSCGGPCKNDTLECGHKCKRVCHTGPCVDDTHPCVSKCEITRSCGHTCQYKCHGSEGCNEELYCKQQLLQTCVCGSRRITRICGVSKENPYKPVDIPLCDDTCARKQRASKMATAFDIDPENPIGLNVFTGWPESVVKLGCSYKNLTLSTEEKLQELVSKNDFSYYYFPQQKFSKANTLISEMCVQYGFIGDVVDGGISKGNVIARRHPNQIPSIPKKLLSKVCETFNPSNPYVDSFVKKPDDYVPQNFIPNGLFITSVPDDVSVDQMKLIIKPISDELKLVSRLYWQTNDSFFLLWETTPTIELIELFQQQLQTQLVELKIEKVDRVFVNNFGGILFEDGRHDHYKKRLVDEWRSPSLVETGWKKTLGSWRNEGLLVD
ncbi:hypothetical protein BC833DRAFT_611933 [Globomyces pollinis-pini]|nr:hypothetical protein BC833DRAFT_611933 [Globomyces pollinis-pini]